MEPLPLKNSDFTFLRYSLDDEKVKQGMDLLKPYLKTSLSETEVTSVRKKVTNLAHAMRNRWFRATRKEDKFAQQNLDWLNSQVVIAGSLITSRSSTSNIPVHSCQPKVSSSTPIGSFQLSEPNTPGTSIQNPRNVSSSAPSGNTASYKIRRTMMYRASRRSASLPYKQRCRRAQQRLVVKISSAQGETTPLLKATSRTLKSRGLNEAAFLIKETMKSPGRALKIKRRIRSGELAENQRNFSAEDALALLLDMGLTKANYEMLRSACRERGHTQLFPSYNQVLNAKNECRPFVGRDDITDTQAEVKLQSLLNHTAERIVKMQKEVIVQQMVLNMVDQESAILVASWGMDGSTGHSMYKQLCFSGGAMDDSSLFATTMVPLQLTNPNSDTLPYWHNKRAQSSNFCRPIKLQFIKEDQALILRETNSIQHQIQQLEPHVVHLDDSRTLVIKFQMHMTLIDGKVLNYVTNTNCMQRCSLCYARPTEFNNIEAINSDAFIVPPNNLKYGASPLHAWIRFLECCLKISYKLDIEVWKVETEEQKVLVAAKKAYIQQQMLEELGLIVDRPKPGGSGSSNDGNTARRAFLDAERFADILGLDRKLIKNFRTILLSINSQLPINVEKFGILCKQTALTYVTKYPWYYMPATIHKILIHGKAIVQSSCLPVGMFGEDAGESRNKLYKYFRLHHTRKSSRLATMTDLFNRAMDTSDPLLSTKRQSGKKEAIRRSQLLPEVLDLIEEPEYHHVRPVLDMTADLDSDYEIAQELDFMLDVEEEVEISSNSLRKLIVPHDLETKFLALAQNNTTSNIETCGILAGTSTGSELSITHLIVPSQSGTANSCTSLNEEEVLQFMSDNTLIQLGWIHTHPTQTSFLSSVDLHTQLSYQNMLPESIAVVCAPTLRKFDMFQLTESGIEVLSECQLQGFHPHPEVHDHLFRTASHVFVDTSRRIEVNDIR